MKKFWKTLMFAALGVFALSSCEDVPAPYTIPGGEGGGTGVTELASVDFMQGIGNWTTEDKTSLSGVWTPNAQYGMVGSGYKNSKANAAESWLISPEIDMTEATNVTMILNEAVNKIDAGSVTDQLTVWVSTDDGQNWTEITSTSRPAGTSWTFQDDTFDLTAYDGQKIRLAFKYVSTTESAPSWEIKSIKFNGEGSITIEGGEPVSATEVTCAEAVELTNALDNGGTSTETYSITGYITEVVGSVSRNQQTFWMADTKDGGKVFEAFYANLPEGVTEFTKGAKVKITGQLTKYVNSSGQVTPEIKNATVEILEEGDGGGTPTPSGESEGDGSESNPYNVAAAFDAYNAGGATGVWVKGYIVGYVDGQVLSSGAKFSGKDATTQTNLLIADDVNETDYTKCVPVQLPTGDVRNALNLQSNPDNYKAEVSLYGNIEKYFGVAGLKTVTKYVIGDGTNDNGNGDDTPSDGSAIDQDFTKAQGNWTIQDVELGSTSYVWQQTAQYGMKASAYVNKTNNATESWLISPALEVGNYTTLTFVNALNFLNNGTMSDHIGVYISTEYTSGDPNDVNWTKQSFSEMPNGASWDWANSTVDLTAYANKTIRVAFKYVSTTSVAPTWEIKSVSVK